MAHMEGIKTGLTNQFQPLAPVPQPHPAPTAKSSQRSSSRLHSGLWFSSPSPSSQHSIPTPHQHRDGGDGVHLYSQSRCENGSQKMRASSNSQAQMYEWNS